MEQLLDRLTLIRTLSKLSTAEFEQVVFTLKTPTDILPGVAASQGERATALLNWADSPTGPGLPSVVELLSHWIDNAESSYQPVRALKPGAPFQAPPLPRHYVHRPEHFAAVKAILLEEGSSGTLVISAIYGMGGIGKSVLAAALVQESDIQRHFPDGILWVTLGQQPDMLAMVNLWIRELGDHNYNPTTLQAASLHLRTLLADKRALLVVDDVWTPEHVEPFRIGGAGCCVLVTTRQTRIIGATRYNLDLMTPQQALALLTQYLPNGLSDAEKVQAETFAKEVGYLPLALELAAAQIEYGVTWEELLEAFQAEMAAPEALDLDSDVASIGDEAIRKRRSLAASFKLTLKLLSPLQLKQFAWLGIVPEDVSLTQQMAATLWGVNSLQASKLLREFRHRALLLPQAQRPGEKPIYRIHDLVHDLAKNLLIHEQYLGSLWGLGLGVEEAHKQFLGRYEKKLDRGQWHTLPDDEYIHGRLSWHFEKAGRLNDIHNLLQEKTPEGQNGWYTACTRLGKTIYFINDINRAWKIAEKIFDSNRTESVLLQFRYALVVASINSLNENAPPELAAALLKGNIWTPDQGFYYILRINQEALKVEAISKIAPYLRAQHISQISEMISTFKDKYKHTLSVIALAQVESGFITKAFAMIHSLESEFFRCLAIEKLISFLQEDFLGEALAVIKTIQNEYLRAQALKLIIPQLSPFLLNEALEIAQSIENRTTLFIVLARFLEKFPNLIDEVLSLMKGVNIYDPQFIPTLARIAPFLSEYKLNGTLSILQDITDDKLRVLGLCQLIPEFTSLGSSALATARRIQDKSEQAIALGYLVPKFPELAPETLKLANSVGGICFTETLKPIAPYLSEELIIDTLEIIQNTQDDFIKKEALCSLAPYLPNNLLDRALEIAQSIQSKNILTSILSALAPYLDEENLYKALQITQKIQDEAMLAQVLITFCSYLPSLFSEALEVSRNIADEAERAQAIGLLAHNSSILASEALSITRKIKDETMLASTLAQLAKYLPRSFIEQIIDIAAGIQRKSSRINIFTQIASYLPKHLICETLKATQSIKAEAKRISALIQLSPYLNSEMRNEALTIAHGAQDDMNRIRALSELTPNLSQQDFDIVLSVIRSTPDRIVGAQELIRLLHQKPNFLREVRAVAQTIEDHAKRAQILIQLLPYELGLVSEILSISKEIQDESKLADILRQISTHLSDTFLDEALELAYNITNDQYRFDALVSLNPHKIDHTLLIKLFHIPAFQKRQMFMRNISKLAPLILNIGGEQEDFIYKISSIMKDVYDQWP